MVNITEVLEELNILCEDNTISKNIRGTLVEVKDMLNNEEKEMDLKLNSAIQLIEDISLDSNISQFSRTQIWNLATMLEDVK